ncbi:H-NS histone family protein [Achromobacter aegrifaciens]|uniref:H-NS histone family protein n=1 Tax=Achromobacter aegrifaciens TaxID=1287736 RepID=A0ABU2DDX8_ACHAE|nr:H-NS histone family protein [Achromobacter aegrifaciens]MDR7946314.1 H-NS histone family protein [Achromobacter aegrifaciens]
MTDYLDLERRFGLLTEYSVDELLALDIMGRKRLGWDQILAGRFSLITARANFGKTMELRACTQRLRDEGKHAVFVALHRLLEESDFQIALEATDAKALAAWEAAPTERLHLFVDSLDEAVLGRESQLQSALRRVSKAVVCPGRDVTWILSSRPATLTPSVLDVVQAEIGATLYVGDTTDESSDDTSEEVDATEVPSAGLSAFDASSTVTAKSVPKENLKVFGLLPLSGSAARLYLENRHGVVDGKAMLDAARRFGLNDLADGPGSLDVLAYVDPVTNPPSDLTSVFERMVSGVQAQQRADHRESLVGRPSPESLDEAVAKLAAASAVCQLPNMELATDVLKVRDGVLSCRPLVGSLLSESSLTYLLGSRLFIDSGQHQVKLYPEQLLPYLASKRLSSLIQSPEDARRLIAALSWRAATGECGVHRAYLAIAGWLATFNVHCRLELLDVEPQAVAFFGDLRSTQVPLADASEALKRSLERLDISGDALGRNQFILTAENYWQAAKPGIEPTLFEAYDRVCSDWRARIALLDIATYARLDVFRNKILSEHGNDYAKLLEDSAELVYLISLERDDDAQALADAAKTSPHLEEGTLRLLLSELGWRTFDADTIAELAAKQYMRESGGFNLGWTLTHDVADSASPEQLAALTDGLLSRMVKHFEAKRDEHKERNDNFAETVQELIALVVRAENLPIERATTLCLMYYQAHGKLHFGSVDQAELRTALKLSDAVRRNLLREVIAQSDRTPDGIWNTFVSYGMYSPWQDGDVEALAEPGFTELVTKLKENAAAHKPTARPDKAKREKLEIDEPSKETLLSEIDSVIDGSNTNALAWIARWLKQTNRNSRYGECDFSAFEKAAGPDLASAARAGLSAIWRKHAPEFQENKRYTTYYVTVAGLQGLHLDLGDGAKLPALSAAEVKHALSYGRFEINGYPKWFWSVVRAHETVALEEFREVLARAGAGVVSSDKAETMIRHLSDAPPAIQRGLGSAVWAFATGSVSVDSDALEASLTCAMGEGGSVDQDAFEREAWSRMSVAFSGRLPALDSLGAPANAEEQKARSELEARIHEMTRIRSNAVIWGLFWLLHYPSAFGVRWEGWRKSERRAAEEFMFDLAAYVGQDRQIRLRVAAERGMGGLKALAALYEWVVTVVRESDDVAHEDGRVYHVGARDSAQRLRDSLLPAIASTKSQAAYVVLDDLRKKTSGVRAKYIRHLQFQMREEEAYVVPVAQQNYAKFERNFAPPVTGSIAFAQAVHNDLLAVKRDIEHGEFSLRRMFNLVVMEHVKSETEGLALEEDFQALLGSELNHASGGRYVVTLEPILPAATRRDVLCQIGDLRATVELKMSERWTIADYLVALEEQLKGQYMQAPNSKVGFFVVVLQRHRKWDNPAGGKLDFDGLIALLKQKALELQAMDPALFLRVVGIDAAPQDDFRKTMAATKAAISGPAKYADSHGNTWAGKGRRPKWLNDALTAGKTLADFEIGQPAAGADSAFRARQVSAPGA